MLSSERIVNVAGGVIEAAGALGEAEIQANVFNLGILRAAGGANLRLVSSAAPVFGPNLTQNAGGLVEADGFSSVRVERGAVNLNAGAVAGRFVFTGCQVNVEAAATGTSPVILAGRNFLGFHRAPGLELRSEADNSSGEAVLETLANAEASGPIRITGVSGWPSRIEATRGLRLQPTGTIRFAVGGGGARGYQGSIHNAGQLVVEPGTTAMFRGRYLGAGGSTEGDLRIAESELRFDSVASLGTTNTLLLVGSDNRLVADRIPAGQTLRLVSSNPYGEARLTATNACAIAGTIRLESADGGWPAGLGGTSHTEWTVEAGGRILALPGTGGTRYVEGDLRNLGEISVGANTLLRRPAAAPSPRLRHEAGLVSVGVGGTFEVAGGEVDWVGGAVSGEIILVNASVRVAPTATAPGTWILAGPDNVLRGLDSPTATLHLRGENGRGGSAFLNVPATVTNRGTLRMENLSGGWPAEIRVRDTATLHNEGTVRLSPGSATPCRLAGRLVHRGNLEAEPGTSLTVVGAVEAAGGLVSGPVSFHDIDLVVTASPAVETTYRLVGSANTLAGTVLPRTVLRLESSNPFGAGRITALAGLTNRGTLELTSVSGSSISELVAETLENTPEGRIHAFSGSGGPCHFSARIHNAGGLAFESATVVLGRPGTVSTNLGTIDSTAGSIVVLGALEAAVGSRLAARGTLSTELGFRNRGTLQPGGTNLAAELTLKGDVEFGADGRLELDVAGDPAEGGFDQITLPASPVALAGTLAIRTTAFPPAQGSPFAVIRNAAPRSGRFAPATGLALTDELAFNLEYTATGLNLVTTNRDPALLAPGITAHPGIRFAAPGAEVTFTVAALGSAPLSYQWFRNGAELPGATGATLVLLPPLSEQNARYACRVANPAGSELSDEGELLVPAVQITASEAARTNFPPVEGDGVILEVFNGVGGGPAPSEAQLAGLVANGTVISPRIDFPHPGSVTAVGRDFDHFFAGTTEPPPGISGLSAANFILRHAFFLRITEDLDLDPHREGIQVILGVGSDDGFELRVGSRILGATGDRGFATSWFSVNFESAGLYPVRLLFAANAFGISGLEFSWKTAARLAGEIVPQAALFSAANAGDRTVTFEEAAPGPIPPDLFLGQGLVVSNTPGLQITRAKAGRFVPVSPVSVFGDPAETGAAAGTVDFRFVVPGTDFRGVTDYFSLWVIDAESAGATVTAYDPDGLVLAARELHGGAGRQEHVVIQSPGIALVRVTLGAGADTAALDDLVFTSPARFNRAPALSQWPDASGDELQPITFAAAAADPDGDPVTYGLLPPVPAGAAIDPVTGVFTWTPSELQGPGLFRLAVAATDNQTPPGISLRTNLVTVREVNQPPVMPPVPELVFDELGTFRYRIVASDPDFQPLTYRAVVRTNEHFTAANALINFDNEFVWVVPPDAKAAIYRGTFFASDGAREVSQPFALRLVRVADLSVVAVSAAAEIESQAESPLTFRVTNLGSAATPGTVVRLWATEDDVFDAAAVELGAYPLPPMLPGATVERIVPQVWPRAAGSYRLVALVDAGDSVAERNEQNNFLAPTNRVRIVPAYSATVRTDTTIASAGTPVELAGSARHRNGQPAAQVVVNVHLRVRDTTRVTGVLTDALGQFRHTFQPLPDEAGSYEVGACHPGEASAPGQDSFQLVHLGFEPATLEISGPVGRRLTNWVTLENLSAIALPGLGVELGALPPGLMVTFTPPDQLPADAAVLLPLVVEQTGGMPLETNVTLTVSSPLGAVRELPFSLKLRPLRPVFTVEPPELEATVLRTNQTIVEFRLRNDGAVASEPVDLALPALPWLRTVSPLPLPGLAPGETRTVTLRLQPGSAVPVGDTTGSFGLTGGGAAVTVPFTFRVRDDVLGSLSVEAVDEYSFHAPGQPRITNAVVSLRRKADGVLVAEQRTDAAGMARFTGLAEGIYDLGVTAAKHSAFGEPVRILAGRSLARQAFLGRHNVEYRFRVEETGVEDRTRLVVEAVFETLAPVPVVTLEPAHVALGQFQPGGGEQVFTVRNHGLLAARNARFKWPSGGSYIFEPLVESLGDLGGRSSVTVPVRVLIDGDRNGRPDGGSARAAIPRRHDQTEEEAKNRPPCPGSPAVEFELECGTNTYTFVVQGQTDANCTALAVGSGEATSGSANAGTVISSTFYAEEGPGCDPCSIEIGGIYARCYFNILSPGALECAESLANYAHSESLGDALFNLFEVIDACGLELKLPQGQLPDLPPGGNPNSAYRKGVSLKKDRLSLKKDSDQLEKLPSAEDLIDQTPLPERLRELIKCLKDLACSCRTGLECPENIDDIIEILLDGLDDGLNPGRDGSAGPAIARATPARHATDPRFFPGQVGVRQQYARLAAVMELFHAYYGGEDWIGGLDNAGATNFHAAFTAVTRPASADGRTISAAERASLLALEPLPDLIDTNEVAQFADRWNRTLDYFGRGWFSSTNVPAGESTDFIAVDRFDKAQYAARLAFARWRQDDVADPAFAIFEATEVLYNNLVESANSGGICARVRLRLDQDAVQTRQGFTASLEMENNGGDPVTALGVMLDIQDLAGRPVAERQFAVLPPQVTGFGAVDGTGTLVAGAAGLASWLIVPGHDAAPTNAPVTYTVGATLVYEQDGYTLTVPLAPAAISVVPQPRLHVAYFHERDVFGDDPFTEPVEPSIPYSLAVRVENRGFGPARSLRIESSQPKVIENDKWLLIDFNLFATEVAGLGVTPALTAEFGDVAPGGSKVARWLFRSSLQGQFVDYSATFQHLGPLSGRPEFSLVESTEIHEMIHLVRVPGALDDGTFDFLVNDQLDDDFLPDAVHFSHGGSAPVKVVRQGSFDGAPAPGDTGVVLNTEAPAGFVYFRLADPANGQWRVTALRRSDGTEVASENVWQTDRTFVAGARQPRRENTLHFFDSRPAAGPATYRLDFAATVTSAQPDSVTRPAGECLTIPWRDLVANDTSAAGRLRVVEVRGGSGDGAGAVSLIPGAIRYVPAATGRQEDSFSYTIQDAGGGIATATVTVRTGPPVVPAAGEVHVRDDRCGPAVLLYRGEAGRRYAVEMAEDLSGGSWQVVAELSGDSLGLVRLDLVEPTGEATQRFYRVTGPVAR